MEDISWNVANIKENFSHISNNKKYMDSQQLYYNPQSGKNGI